MNLFLQSALRAFETVAGAIVGAALGLAFCAAVIIGIAWVTRVRP